MTNTPPQPSEEPSPPPSTEHHRRLHRRRTSCIIATALLILPTLGLPILFFTLFRPQSPTITTLSIQLPSFSTTTTTNSTTTLATFTFSLNASVTNPNRFSVFSHIDSNLQLLHANRQVGVVFIPAGKIGSGQTQYVSATFTVWSLPVEVALAAEAPGPGVADGLGGGFGGGTTAGPNVEMESKMEIKGSVRFLHFFTHHAKSVSDCRVNVGVSDGSVLGYHCHSN